MLKALEISGFKSFADKTRFEFPAGITVVVGPNGSGKSNIVDAIKWVLGEQSAKSLRGKDMSDVIFKGSTGAGARKPAGSATAMIVLDNADRRFPYDADEVHLGRRVYRSGETEYLINGETSRLKDIKNLLRGTGIGTDAYSLIEQGKVDRLLQASAKDRRAIFEEAAGISRFKAKKTEATRRLTRVEESLIRLADIVDEVGSRYRSVKSQASKAAKYKEYSERLQQLRTFVGMKDWRSFSESLEKVEQEQQQHTTTTEDLSHAIQQSETRAQEFEKSLAETSGQLEAQHLQVSEQREKIAQTESKISLNESRLNDLNERAERFNEQEQRAQQRAELANTNLQETQQESEQADSIFHQASTELTSLETRLLELDAQIEEAKQSVSQTRNRHSEIATLITELGRIVSAADSQAETLNSSRTRYLAEVEQLSDQAQSRKQIYDSLLAEQEALKEQAAKKDSALSAARQHLETLSKQLAEQQQALTDINNKHTGLTKRAEVIEELEKRLEGINAGAKELLQLSHQATDGPLTEIQGLVADLVSVNVEHATIVDAALGEVAQFVVVQGEQLIQAMATESLKVRGRVGILRLGQTASLNADPKVDLTRQEGVIGRASQLVSHDTPHGTFVTHLLSGTWVVKTLIIALEIWRYQGPRVRFVTLDGEVVEADGTIIVGPKSSAVGLVSRRSELRSLKRQITELENQISEFKSNIANLQQQVEKQDAEVKRLYDENSELTRQLSDRTSKANTTRAQLKSISEQLQKAQNDLKQTTTRLEQLNGQLADDQQKLAKGELESQTLSELILQHQLKLDESQKQRSELEKTATSARVRLAKCEQTRESHLTRLQELQQDLKNAKLAAQELAAERNADESANKLAQAEMATAKKILVELTAANEQHAARLDELISIRSKVDQQRKETAGELSRFRDQLRKAQDALYQVQLQIEQLRSQRSQLAERLLEDYQIDIATIENVELSEDEQAQREKIDEEINTLRKRISTIGSVNVDALNELEELETRYTTMDEQYQDLVQAKETLEKIIVRINADSRRLFVETLEAIRINFQKLFRQTFGGGQADIIMEEGVDPLEAGVEIIATPPGKPQFSNSLLSGGEKALTAVSLLMAIFQFRPSPFCVLDEVDAPFDEANIGRFIDVLRSFLGWTKFVIVTHSKKTMTAATTLYGVTMQESGVSKRVSVRFEDVSEDGQISQDAIDRDDEAA